MKTRPQLKLQASATLTALALIAWAIPSCSSSSGPSVAYDSVVSAAESALTAECECLASEDDQYTSVEACVEARGATPEDAWISCANDAIESGGHSAAMSCLVEAYQDAVACIKEIPCGGQTYSLSVAACLESYTANPNCPGLSDANAAIDTACNTTSGGGGGGLSGGPRRLGDLCLEDSDCISGFCLESEYGAPFCSRICDEPQVDCPAGDDAEAGEALCVSFAEDQLPYAELLDAFQGETDTFCVPRCINLSACRDVNESWETCEMPKYKGTQLYPTLGTGEKVCQSPSHHGKDPVDPAACNYQKTIGIYGTEASLCGFYCDFLETCLYIDSSAYPEGCCEWGCFSRMVPDGTERDDAWHDEVKCYVEDHAAWPAVGVDNFCNHPEKACGGQPDDPTHPAAIPN